MTWVLIVGGAWLTVSVVAALLIAGTIHLADRRRGRPAATAQGNFVVDLQSAPGSQSSAAPSPPEPRRSVPGARKPVVRDCIPPSERASITRDTGTR